MNTVIKSQSCMHSSRFLFLSNRINARSKNLKLSVFTAILMILFYQNGYSAVNDTTKYLTLKDTLFITLDENTNEKILEHKIQKGQTLYSLARFYGLNEEELYPYNPTLKSNVVSVGQIVRIPLPNSAIKRFKGDNFKRWKYAPIVFKVKKGDNLYKIAKTLFHMPVDSVVKWNNLQKPVISPGQNLHVGWMSLGGVPDTIRNIRKSSVDIKKKQLAANFEKQTKTVEQRGAAFWQKNGNPNTDYYCLHRTAKIGSTISITNGMNFKTVYAKVIGKIPENAHGNEVVIIVAPSVAKQLAAKDEKFFVKIKYSE